MSNTFCITVADYVLQHKKATITTKEDVTGFPIGSVLKGDTTYNNRFTVLGADGHTLVISGKIPVEGLKVGTKFTQSNE